MSEPKIYTRNWVDSQSVFVLTHGGTPSCLFDRNTTPLYTTTGATGQAIYVTMYFYEGGIAQTRDIDTIIAKNHNFLNWGIDRWNGSSWVSIYSNTNESGTNKYISVTKFSTIAVRFSCLTTNPGSQEKTIGEFIACTTSFSSPDFSTYDPKWRERSKEIVLGDGSIHRVIVKDATGRIGKYEAATKWSYLTKAERDSLKAIKDAGQPFLLQPESVTVPEDVYYVHWANAWDEKYMSSYKGSGYEVVMNVKEV